MSARAKDQLLREFDRWGFDERGWSQTTRRRYYQRAIAADCWLSANRGVSLIWATPKDLKAYLFSTPPDARNRNNIRQAIIGFCDYLVHRGLSEVNPATALPRLPEPESLPKPLTLEEAKRIARVAPVFGPMVAALVGVYLGGGLRKTEGRLLMWSQVKDDGWLVFRGKGSKERAVPLQAEPAAALLAWRAQCPDPVWCFPSSRRPGHPISDTWVKEVIREVGQAAGIDGLHPHVLRHTVATRTLELTGDLRTVQELLGHADPKTTTIYTKVRPSRVREAMAKLDFWSAMPAVWLLHRVPGPVGWCAALAALATVAVGLIG